MKGTKLQEGSQIRCRVCWVSLTTIPMHSSNHKWLRERCRRCAASLGSAESIAVLLLVLAAQHLLTFCADLGDLWLLMLPLEVTGCHIN